MPAVALDNLIADVPVDASIEQALSPVVNPIVQYVVSTPALATPLATLLGVNSQLVSVLFPRAQPCPMCPQKPALSRRCRLWWVPVQCTGNKHAQVTALAKVLDVIHKL